MEGTKVYTQ